MNDARGFTLLELSIVLVIIGLIVGGVVVGQEMVKTAQIRKEIAEIDAYASAITAFHTKYNQLPGDMPDATRFFAGSANGNGDGMIQGLDGSGIFLPRISETVYLNHHLASAGLIPLGPFDLTLNNSMVAGVAYIPLPSRSGMCVVSPPGTQVNLISIGCSIHEDAAIALGNLYTVFAKLSPFTAWTIDQKIDDGLPRVGKIINSNTTPTGSFPNYTNTSYCHVAATQQYYIDKNDSRTFTPTGECGLKISGKL